MSNFSSSLPNLFPFDDLSFSNPFQTDFGATRFARPDHDSWGLILNKLITILNKQAIFKPLLVRLTKRANHSQIKWLYVSFSFWRVLLAIVILYLLSNLKLNNFCPLTSSFINKAQSVLWCLSIWLGIVQCNTKWAVEIRIVRCERWKLATNASWMVTLCFLKHSKNI